MEVLWLALFVGALIVPVIVARTDMSGGKAFLTISALPGFVAFIGLGWYFQASDSNSSMQEAWSGIYLIFPVLALIAEVIALIVFAITRHFSGKGSKGPMNMGSSESRD